MKNIVLKIEGMSCSACSNGLEKYLNKQEGVEASVNLVMATANINYDDDITISDLERFIDEAGFKSLGEDIKIDDEKSSKVPFIVYGVLGVLLLYISMSHMVHLPVIPFLNMMDYPINYGVVLLILTIPFMFYGFDILKSGIKNLIHRMPNMDTLVSIGIVSSFLYSLFGVIMMIIGKTDYVESLYFESAAFVIYFIKLGRFIENESKNKTKDSIKELVKITPEVARLKTDNDYKNVTIDEVKVGDILICLPGDRASVDGEIVKGDSHFDESFVTGESLPVEKKKGSKIIAGSINFEGKVEYKAERIGKDSTISEIVRLVVESINTKAPISKIADKICSYFVPGVIIIAILTLIINLLFGNTFSVALTRFVSVLVIACPCSLGLATPLALVISVGLSAGKGILIKNSESLEMASKIDTIVFDKTGTLTNGILTISQVNKHCDLSEKELFEILASIEANSTHPLAKGINKYVKDRKIKCSLDLDTEDLAGYGVKGKDKNNTYYACNAALLEKLDIINSYKDEEINMAKDGNSVIYLVRNKKVMATFGLKDVIRDESKEVVNNLKNMNIDVVMLSGDNSVTANKIAKELGISTVISDVSPKDKNKYIKDLCFNGKKVMMVGDGINDAPSLTEANVGVSLQSATDIAANSADIVLANNNLLRIIDLIKISKATIKNIKENLFWAFLYNICMIPFAIGLFGISISPMIACIAMIISSLTVTFNALRLRRLKNL